MTRLDTKQKIINLRINGRTIRLHTLTANPDNPVILYLHGGPGYGNSRHLCEIFNSLSSTLVKEYSLIFYDQRCAGDSMSIWDLFSNFTVENHVSDAGHVLKYSLKLFSKNKLILCSHSWGTHLGMKLADRFSNLIQGYVGIGQIVNGLRGEKMAYAYALKHKGKKGVAKLVKYGPPPHRKKELVPYLSLHRKILLENGGLDRSTTTVKDNQDRLNPSKTRLINALKHTLAMYLSVKYLWEQCLEVDFSDKTHFNFPVIFVCGKYDQTTPTKLVINYFRSIRTPANIYIVDKSAHRPHLENFEKFEAIMVKEKSFLTSF
mgnify:CR=1 FL=1